MKLKIFFDGSSHGNPGPSGIGVVVYNQDFVEVARFSEYVGVRTNNEAEYLALKKALEIALQLDAEEVELYSDSELLVKQISGEYNVKNKNLLNLHREVQELMEKVKVKIMHIDREENKLADKLANEAAENPR